MTEREERARHAQALLDDPLWREAITELREAKIADFAQSAPTDHEARETAYREMKAVEAIEHQLGQWIRDHAFAMKKGQHRVND